MPELTIPTSHGIPSKLILYSIQNRAINKPINQIRGTCFKQVIIDQADNLDPYSVNKTYRQCGPALKYTKTVIFDLLKREDHRVNLVRKLNNRLTCLNEFQERKHTLSNKKILKMLISVNTRLSNVRIIWWERENMHLPLQALRFIAKMQNLKFGAAIFDDGSYKTFLEALNYMKRRQRFSMDHLHLFNFFITESDYEKDTSYVMMICTFLSEFQKRKPSIIKLGLGIGAKTYFDLNYNGIRTSGVTAILSQLTDLYEVLFAIDKKVDINQLTCAIERNKNNLRFVKIRFVESIESSDNDPDSPEECILTKKIDDSELINCLKNLNYLRWLEFEFEVMPLSSIRNFMSRLEEFKQIRMLILKFNSNDFSDRELVDNFANSLKNMSNVEHLILKCEGDCELEAISGIGMVYETLGSMIQLRSLRIYNDIRNKLMNMDSRKKFFDAIRKLPNLHTILIQLSNDNLGDPAARFISHNLSQMKQLKDIELDFFQSYKVSTKAWFILLKRLEQLNLIRLVLKIPLTIDDEQWEEWRPLIPILSRKFNNISGFEL